MAKSPRKRAPGAGRKSLSGTVGSGESPPLKLRVPLAKLARLDAVAVREESTRSAATRQALDIGLVVLERYHAGDRWALTTVAEIARFVPVE